MYFPSLVPPAQEPACCWRSFRPHPWLLACMGPCRPAPFLPPPSPGRRGVWKRSKTTLDGKFRGGFPAGSSPGPAGGGAACLAGGGAAGRTGEAARGAAERGGSGPAGSSAHPHAAGEASRELKAAAGRPQTEAPRAATGDGLGSASCLAAPAAAAVSRPVPCPCRGRSLGIAASGLTLRPGPLQKVRLPPPAPRLFPPAASGIFRGDCFLPGIWARVSWVVAFK